MKVQVGFQEPDKKKRIKRIIAREGLVIIGILLSAIVLFIVGDRIPYEGPTYVYRCSFGGKVYEVEMNRYYSTWDDKDKFDLLEAISRLYPKSIEQEGEWLTLPEDFKVERGEAKYTLKGKIKNFFSGFWVFILFLSYPIYLLIRFIIWAIKTLKKE